MHLRVCASGRLSCALGALFVSLFGAEGRAGCPGLAALNEHANRHPGVLVYVNETCNLIYMYGNDLAVAETAEGAAENWLNEWSELLVTGESPDLRSLHAILSGDGKFTIFEYQQYWGELPIVPSRARVIILNSMPYRAIFASASGLATVPPELPLPPLHSVEDISASIHGNPELEYLYDFVFVEFVAIEDNLGAQLVQAHRFRARDPLGVHKYSIYFDSLSGKLIRVQPDTAHAGAVTGTARAYVSPGIFPDLRPAHPPNSLVPLRDLRIELDPSLSCANVGCAGGAAVTGASGTYSAFHGGGGQVKVRTDLLPPSCGGEPFIGVIDFASPPSPVAACSSSVTPPTSVDLTLNAAGDWRETAQVNTQYHLTRGHNFFQDRVPTYPHLSDPVVANVNIPGACIAGGGDTELGFGVAGQWPGCPTITCANFAYSTIIAHEWGHTITNFRLASHHSVSSFGEGFADAVMMMIYDSPWFGFEACGSGTSLRDYQPGCNTVKYPCLVAPPLCQTENNCGCGVDLPHGCAKLLAGIWWDIKQNIGDRGGDTPFCGTGLTQHIFANWASMTAGGSSDLADAQGAHPGTMTEILTVDDSDGNLSNGTPRACEICDGFRKHGLYCPEVVPGWDTNSNSIPDQCQVLPRGSRYIDITPGIDDIQPVALRVTSSTLPCISMFVSATGLLTSTPVFQTRDDWLTVHIHDDEIAPLNTYTIETYVGGTGTFYGQATTAKWGDCNGSGTVTIDDILCVSSGFSGCYFSCKKEAVDLHPCVPNGLITLDDVLAAISAFQGNPWPCPNPCSGGGSFAGESGGDDPQPESALISLVPRRNFVSVGTELMVDVFIEGYADLRGYEVSLDAIPADGKPLTGRMPNIDKERSDFVFSGLDTLSAIDGGQGRVMSALFDSGVANDGVAYLGTFVFETSADSDGLVAIQLRPGGVLLRNSADAPIVPEIVAEYFVMIE